MEKKDYAFKGLVMNGFLALFLIIALIIVAIRCLLAGNDSSTGLSVLGGILVTILSFCMKGIVKNEPNEAKVMLFFGKYRGTFERTGFYWVNPLLTRKAVNLRARNMNPDPIKVNDKTGNPVLIGMVVVWQLEDTYKALFDIDYQSTSFLENFVAVQSDAALRQVAGRYAYDNAEDPNEPTLRSNAESINDELEQTLNERLAMAGIHIIEARINYLAYAPEIAAVMLRRQQADAIITAREKIVDGAVSMVKMALDKLKDEGVVDLDEERKAAMVSNLLVVLCGDEPAQPVVNSGSLY